MGLGARVLLTGMTAASLALAAPSAGATTGVPKVDINKDGYADTVIVSNFALFLRLTDGNGGSDGTWQRIAATDHGNVSEVAACDFNGDGYTDVAAGQPYYDLGGAGAVVVRYGSATGLGSAKVLTQDSPGVPGAAEDFDNFGASVACGPVGSDRYHDLLVGAPGEAVGSLSRAGMVTVLKGSSGGLTGQGALSITQDTTGVPGTAERHDQFGSKVAVGDVTGDGVSELVILSVGDLVSDPFVSGAPGLVHSLMGSATGWTATGTKTVSCLDVGMSYFVNSLTLGRFDGSGALDVVVGGAGLIGPGVNTPSSSVAVLRGSASNITPDRYVRVDQSAPGVPGADEPGDGFGETLAAGDVTGDGRDDLLIGVAGEDVGSVTDGGAVVLLKGGSGGLTGSGAQAFSQDASGVPGASEDYDRFGSAVAMSDFDGNGRSDALIGAPDEFIGTLTSAGAVTRLPGTSAGLTASGSVSLTTGSIGFPLEMYESFGLAIR